VLIPGIGAVENGLCFCAVCLGNRVSSDTCDLGVRVGNDNAILNIEALDLVESSTSSSGVGKELSDNCEDFVGIDGHSRPVEGLVANTVRIEITSIRIASTAISVRGVSSTACVANTLGLRSSIARMRSKSGGDGICLPDIHLSAARSVITNASVDIV